MRLGTPARLSPAGVALAIGLAGCSDAGPALAPSAARIALDDGMMAQHTALAWFASAVGATAAIDPDAVASLTVEITGVAFLPVGDADADEASWQSLPLVEAVTLDLMALPAVQEGSLEIAAGAVPVGAYRKVRLRASGGEIVFTGPVSLGTAVTFDGGVAYPVTIPSGATTGLKTDVSFEVAAGADETANAAYLVFEPATTFQNVSAQGTSGVTLAPVLRAR